MNGELLSSVGVVSTEEEEFAPKTDLYHESKQIMVFFPDLSWYVAHKTEHLTNIYYLLFIVLFAFSMLKVKATFPFFTLKHCV